ncbi:hypothetical protein MRX96_006137 [Rhipicephalus microplus]
MVALDGLPLSLTKGAGFKQLMEFLKPESTSSSSRTVSQTLESLVTKFSLPHALIESLHFIEDIWTSRIRKSIIGVRIQFFQNLKLHTVSFTHIEGRHTSENLRKTFLTELRSRDARETHVGTVVCDNAANMTKVFNMENRFYGGWQEVPADEDECDKATQYPLQAQHPHLWTPSLHLSVPKIGVQDHASRRQKVDDEPAEDILNKIANGVVSDGDFSDDEKEEENEENIPANGKVSASMSSAPQHSTSQTPVTNLKEPAASKKFEIKWTKKNFAPRDVECDYNPETASSPQ